MAEKQKHRGIGAKGSRKMKYFRSLAPLYKKHGESAYLGGPKDSLTITQECRQVFGLHSNKAAGYDCTHPEFPGTTFQVIKNNFKVTEEGEVP